MKSYTIIVVWYTEYYVSIEIQEPHKLHMQNILLLIFKHVFYLTVLSFTLIQFFLV